MDKSNVDLTVSGKVRDMFFSIGFWFGMGVMSSVGVVVLLGIAINWLF